MLESPHTGMWRYTRRAGNESEPSKSIGDRDGEASPRSLLRRIKKKKQEPKKMRPTPHEGSYWLVVRKVRDRISPFPNLPPRARRQRIFTRK